MKKLYTKDSDHQIYNLINLIPTTQIYEFFVEYLNNFNKYLKQYKKIQIQFTYPTLTEITAGKITDDNIFHKIKLLIK